MSHVQHLISIRSAALFLLRVDEKCCTWSLNLSHSNPTSYLKDQLIVISKAFKKTNIQSDVGSSHQQMLSRNRCSSNPILGFDNKLMEGSKTFCKFLEDISKGVRFNKAAALHPIYLLNRALLLKKILMFMLRF